jgi:hypothetical protein
MWIYTSTPPYTFMALVLNYLSTGTISPFLALCYMQRTITKMSEILFRDLLSD